jgi:hypothetical protein
MFSTCANPGCTKSFNHRQGQMFRFPQNHSEPANAHAVRHFWLCEWCSKSYTLEEHPRLGVFIVNRFEPARAPLLIY